MMEDDTWSSTSSEDEIGGMILLMELTNAYDFRILKQPCRTSVLSGREYIIELLNGHPDRIYDSFRMNQCTFRSLCQRLKSLGYLKDDKIVSVEEAVGIFLITVGHNMRNRIVSERFQHSQETISRQFNRVLKALCKLAIDIIQPPNMRVTPQEIIGNFKYYPWFKVCKKNEFKSFILCVFNIFDY